MKIINAEFVKSCVEIKDCPTGLPEFAFIGRSNVGKSSLINMLVNNKKLAKTSSKPGKTQTINYFIINFLWHIVDLPGYGYAKTSKKNRRVFEKIINRYILQSPNLMSLFVLVDISISPQKIDIDFINNLGTNEIPFVILLTKSDKIKKSIRVKNVEAFKNILGETWAELPKMILTSSKKQLGKDEILAYIKEVNKLYKK